MSQIEDHLKVLLSRYASPETAELVLDTWNERAAVREHEGGLPRGKAEEAALADILIRNVDHLPPVSISPPSPSAD